MDNTPMLHLHHRPLTAPVPATACAPWSVRWARHLDEVRAAQRLRHAVFVGEMGARLRSPLPGHDIDLFDDYCEHLLVTGAGSDEVIGTYRVLTPAQARRVGSTYSDTEFDLTRLRQVRDRMVELGRSCVHPDHRTGGVILALWSALGGFMQRNGLDVMIGCASVPMHQDGRYAAGLWQRLRHDTLAPIDWQVRPRLPLPIDRIDPAPGVQPPALVKGYLRLGAKVMGPPAWDPDFNVADLPLVMRLQDLAPRHRKHLLGGC
jgi:putative hemolysin